MKLNYIYYPRCILKEMPLTDTYSTEDKISAYLKEKSINAFSLYYELLDFIISDYHEEVLSLP